MSFPPELIYAFVECLRDDKEVLATCAQVSQCFLSAARKYLFQAITYDGGQRPFENFLELIVERPHIAKYIRSLKLHAPNPCSFSEALCGRKPRAELSLSLISQILANLPRLQMLEVRSVYLTHTPDAALPSLPISTLAVGTLFVDDTRHILRLLHMLPCKELRLHSLFHPGCPRTPTPTDIAEMASEPCFPVQMEVKDLKLWSSTYYDTPWLLYALSRTSSLQSIETLDVECSWANHPGPDVRSFVADVGPNLRSLTVRVRNDNFPLFVTEDFITSKLIELFHVDGCTSLTEVNIHSPADRCLFRIAERIMSRVHSIQYLNVHVALKSPLQAGRIVGSEFTEWYARIQDRAHQLPFLQQMRFTLQMSTHNKLPRHGPAEECPIENLDVYQAIRLRMPELEQKGLLRFGVDY